MKKAHQYKAKWPQRQIEIERRDLSNGSLSRLAICLRLSNTLPTHKSSLART
ncbi:MAG: hypothetical protein K0S11_901 [Gammaproteobacteria bacterium]|jgi:hypothetical protein|nr:hypothetical protein [Gammaproteobacteria bacterium]